MLVRMRGRRRLSSTVHRSNRLDGRFHCLGVALVEVEGGVELGLAGEQFLELRIVLEWLVGLGLIVA